jgi:hypothetical protein
MAQCLQVPPCVRVVIQLYENEAHWQCVAIETWVGSVCWVITWALQSLGKQSLPASSRKQTGRPYSVPTKFSFAFGYLKHVWQSLDVSLYDVLTHNTSYPIKRSLSSMNNPSSR